MYYVMVPEYFDGYLLYPFNKKCKGKTLIGHELFTWKEYIKLKYKYDNVPDLRNWIFKISQYYTYTSFGCRFMSHDLDYRSIQKIEQEDFYDILNNHAK